ncbi:BglII/BstYI family type II restriction endonuclease [Hellea sp.]|nr:BglII/BstYI family type II restriction endonuclease [Hellea sp.]
MFQKLRDRGFDVVTLHHAEAILKHDMQSAEAELEKVLCELEIPITELVRGGGGEAKLTQRLRNQFSELGWKKHNFEIQKSVDGRITDSQSHEIDHIKQFGPNTCALEIEWNNKDPFYDRDLENFKRLHAEGAISVGVIVTRGRSLHESLRDLMEQFALTTGVKDIQGLSDFNYKPTDRQRRNIAQRAEKLGFARGWAETFVSDKFGQATTHWAKLEDRVNRGVGNPCPLVLLGIPLSSINTEN